MIKLIAPFLLTLVLTACGGGGGGGSAPATPASNTKALQSVLTYTSGSIRNMAVGDLNGDGLDDVVVGGWSGPGSNTNIYVLIQNTDGTLVDRTASILPVVTYGGSQRIFIQDFDNDGRNDIFIPGFNDGCVGGCAVNSVIFWNQPGQFVQQTLPEQLDSHGACVDDINNDGRLDVLVRGVYDQATHTTQGGLYINNGNRSFTFSTAIGSGATCSINHESNGRVSIVAGNSNHINTYDSNLNLISTVNVSSQDPATNDLIDSVSLDVNNDGHRDFILVFNSTTDNTKGRREVWTNNGAGNYTYAYTVEDNVYSLYHHRALVFNGTQYLYVSGSNLQSRLYKIQNNTVVAYNQNRFVEMAQQAGYTPGFNWSVDSGVVYQNSSTGKLYMLQSINRTLYTQEM
jgi:hypothetical protein